MRLEPVYLLAPKPKPPSMPTRRAILIAGGTFVAGFGVGGACGYAAGSRAATGGDSTSEPELQPSGDADLDELRRLAVKAPIEELVGKRVDFVDRLYLDYPKDEIAWKGVGRLAEAMLSNSSFPDRRTFARWVAQVIEKSTDPVRTPLLRFVPELRMVK